MTFNRATLKKMAEQGRLEMIDSYHFDDMHGEERTEKVLPVEIIGEDRGGCKEGVCRLFPFDFKSKSGRAWKNPNGTITLKVHSNCSFTFRVKAIQ